MACTFDSKKSDVRRKVQFKTILIAVGVVDNQSCCLFAAIKQTTYEATEVDCVAYKVPVKRERGRRLDDARDQLRDRTERFGGCPGL